MNTLTVAGYFQQPKGENDEVTGELKWMPARDGRNPMTTAASPAARAKAQRLGMGVSMPTIRRLVFWIAFVTLSLLAGLAAAGLWISYDIFSQLPEMG